YALIRRRQFDSNNMLDFNEIKINLISKELTVNDHPVTLTKTEYELLLFLIGNKNKVISKSAIAEHLSGDMADMLDNFDFVYAHIKNLKSKLQEQGCADYIKNVYGTGYKWTS
ncbi:MAG: winged helix-turn-helix domain-containing protein, partial [Bacteroidaceae bacterium]|nr:winged helix-turn-helix domain-containing protein [Bacteroidaceae bacterium]